jgi:hypothetical protein
VNQKNLTNEQAKLYRVWYSDGNDRDEIVRVKAFDMGAVEKLLKAEFIKPDSEMIWFAGDDECSVYELTPKEPEETEETDEDDFEQEIETISIELEENPEEDDYSLKLIDGTNHYYDLTQPKVFKAPDWNPTLASVWHKNPQKGCDMLQQLTLEGKLPE